ncbi:Potassium-transporting ATPase KdpC subunit [Sporomusa carbonis]|uniref:potassium-transporting ATPase subunit KdpC n=1 Tax=Sporomusa carbonis TaxID=3076075 RepID=UPI003A606213
MWKHIINSLAMLVVMTILTGLIYPLAMTGLAQALFPRQANGSLIINDGVVVGSSLIGQQFTKPEYFHGRPSAAGEDGYDAADSAGSNLSATSSKLTSSVADRLAAVRSMNGLAKTDKIPADAVLASGSGLDPHISPDYASLQTARVAAARGLTVDQVRRLVDEHTTGRLLGIIGEPRVNVLQLNLALDALKK